MPAPARLQHRRASAQQMRDNAKAMVEGSVGAVDLSVETPLYLCFEVLESGAPYFYAKPTRRGFADPAAFLQHAAALRQKKSPDDLQFEQAAQTLLDSPQAPPQPPEPKPLLAPPEPPEGYVSARLVRASAVAVELLEPSDAERMQTVRVCVDGQELVGPRAVREGLAKLGPGALGGCEESQLLVNMVKTYIPIVPREGYSFAGAVDLIARKVRRQAERAAVAAVATGEHVVRVADVERPAPYVLGSVEERQKLRQVTAQDTTQARNPLQGCGGHPRGYFTKKPTLDVANCYVCGTAEQPVVVTPDGTMSLLEFVEATNCQGVQPKVVGMARRLAALEWCSEL